MFGPSVDNYIVRSFENNPFIPVLDGVDEEFQLVHEDDVATALIALIDGKAGGAFNLAGDGTHDLAAVRGADRQEDPRGLAQEHEALQRRDVAAPRARAPRRPRATSTSSATRGSSRPRSSSPRPNGSRSSTPSRPSSSPCGPRACCPEPSRRSRRRPRRSPSAPGRCYLSPPGRLAQLGERQLDKLEVTGSSPVAPIADPATRGLVLGVRLSEEPRSPVRASAALTAQSAALTRASGVAGVSLALQNGGFEGGLGRPLPAFMQKLLRKEKLLPPLLLLLALLRRAVRQRLAALVRDGLGGRPGARLRAPDGDAGTSS